MSAAQNNQDSKLNLATLQAGSTLNRENAAQRLRARAKRLLLSDYFILVISILGYFIAAQFFDRLARPLNITNQLSNMWPLFAVAIGQTFVLVIAGIDLSQGAIMALTSVTGAMIMSQALNPDMFDRLPLWGVLLFEDGGILSGHPLATPITVIWMLAIGTFVGFIVGTLITRFKITPFIASLVGFIFFSFFALWLTQSRNISGLPESFIALGDAGEIISVYLGEKVESQIPRRDILAVVTSSTVIAIALAILASYLLNRTVFGKHMFAIGTNRRAAEISGVPVNRTIILVYMFSGFCAAVASILFTARLEIGRPTLGGLPLLLDIIGSCVIGGSSFFGGKGSIKGTFFGVVFFTLMINVLNAAQMSPFVIDAVKGGVILTAAILDNTRTRLLNKEQVT